MVLVDLEKAYETTPREL